MNLISPCSSAIFDLVPANNQHAFADECGHRVVYHPGADAWVVSSYQDVSKVLLDPDIFAVDNALDAVTPMAWEHKRELLQRGVRLPPTLVNNSRVTHKPIRMMVNRFFTGRHLKDYEELFNDWTATAVLDIGQRVVAGDTIDISSEISELLPAQMIRYILGFEDLNQDTYRNWVIAGLTLFFGKPTPDEVPHMIELVAQMYQFIRKRLLDNKIQKSPLLTGLLKMEQPTLSSDEQIDVVFFLLIAGQFTTTELINSALHRLYAYPDARPSIDEPSSIKAFCEECLRVDPPATVIRRVATRDTILAGHHISRGETLLLLLAAANVDPQKFMCPHVFDADRPNPHRHLAFSMGSYRCVGAALARMETETVLRAFLNQIPKAAMHITEESVELLAIRPQQRLLMTLR